MINAKLLQFALRNWKEILVILSLSVVTLKTRIDHNALNKAYEISQQSLKEQVDSLKKIHDEELRQRDEALKSYRNLVDTLERNYLESQNNLEKTRQEKTARYERQFSQDKGGLANAIINDYGFEHVKQ